MRKAGHADRLPFSVRQAGRNVHVVEVEAQDRSSWEQWFLLRSDAHHDNAFCDQDLEKKHLKQTVERNAGIIDCGDLFCSMQGKYDKRSDKSQCRPEHQVNDYLDALLQSAAEFYAPFARNIVVLGPGNHETAVTDRHGVDLTQQLAARLSEKAGCKVHTSGYSGFVRFHFKTTARRLTSRVLWFHHGYGGGGPVTKDIIQASRKAMYMPDADFVLSGHTHDEWVFPITRVRLNSADRVVHDRQWHVKVPGYKDEYRDGFGGWHIGRGGPPKPRGSAWLRFYWGGPDKGVCSEVFLTGEG